MSYDDEMPNLAATASAMINDEGSDHQTSAGAVASRHTLADSIAANSGQMRPNR